MTVAELKAWAEAHDIDIHRLQEKGGLHGGYHRMGRRELYHDGNSESPKLQRGGITNET
jgi:hypothetical protein